MALGPEIHRTPDAAGFEGPAHLVSIAAADLGGEVHDTAAGARRGVVRCGRQEVWHGKHRYAPAMAAVLDALAPYVQKLIMDVAREEVSMLLGVSGEIIKLEDNVGSIKAFLTDAERRRITDESVQRWARKLKNAMYDATDILDLCQLEADKRRESKRGGFKEKVRQPLFFCLRNPMFAHKIGSSIKELTQRLEDIYMEADRFKFNIGLGSNPEPRKPTDSKITSLKTSSEFNEYAIVGEKIENDTKELAQVLINNDKFNIKMVSVVGAGGMGKTTLAQKIFKEKTIQEQFKVKIWLCITQYFDEVDLLQTAIEHAGGDHGGKQDKSLLMRTLTDILSKDKFLLVMDDVWSDKAWNNVLKIPILNASHEQTGSQVLVTTRLEDLAPRMQTSYYQHHVSPLNEEDAWSLLKKQLPPQPNQVVGIDHLKDVGMKIIKKCGGLPLAIKVMGGLLSTRSQSELEWEAVLNHHAWSVAGLPKELDHRLYLSYEDLSPQLKQCFLYCSLFPKGTDIRKRDVIPMWISEGFIQPLRGSSSREDQLEDIANEYYRDLIMRNLIEPKEGCSLSGYHCSMHDVVRSFAEFMAREESLVVQDEQAPGSSSHSLLRRLSIGSTKSVPEWGFLEMQKSIIRTLIINHSIDDIKPIDSLCSLSSLRVLLIRGNADYDRLVDSLCQWKHLRYLHLENTGISRLPQEIYRIKFLQHIVLRGSTSLENLPRSIIELVHLRTLDLGNLNVKNILIPKGFGQLTNLSQLFGFPVNMDMDKDGAWCSLEEIGPLSQLRHLTIFGLDNVAPSSLAEKARISRKKHLTYLELNWSSSKEIVGSWDDEAEKQLQQRAAEEVIEKLCPPPCIQDVRIYGYIGRMLPNWMMIVATAAFKSLRCLGLKDLPCCTKLPDGLCRLPSLEELFIVNAPAIKNIGFEFQASSSFEVGVTATLPAFPSLTCLNLDDLCEWEEWSWEEHAVDATAHTTGIPALKELSIRNCKLSVLPPGLANSTREALRELQLHNLRNLTSVENFSSVVELDVFRCPRLKRINGLSRLQKIRISRCSNVVVLEGVPSLDSMEVEDKIMETLPGYLRDLNPRYFKLKCCKKLYQSIMSGSSCERDKISHIPKHAVEYC
ncbi:unnamed protein product [Urochloa decumbens]|uniref:Uncharacterized protein n=1 Tax=Urochloa decumbens TaxID=240449 RepID=A0ABC9B8B3_9POAL